MLTKFMNKKLAFLLAMLMSALILSACSGNSGSDSAADATEEEQGVIDYMVLVNKENPLPEGWEEALDIVELKDSQGWDVQVERTAYEAYLGLKEDLEKDDVHVDLDSAYRSIAEQQRIVDEFTEKYGEDYVKKYVAVPGYSEHHTGLALDLYLNIDGEDVYLNEEMVKYPEVWEQIHAKLADHGFILRYMQGKADITGYAYEPWHIRYVGTEAAKEITDRGITLEEYFDKIPATAAKVDYGKSELYSQDEMDDAITAFKKEFETWDGCELHSVKYAGDECNSEENIKWMNELKEGRNYDQCIEFLTDFHSPVEDGEGEPSAFEPDHEYEDYQWYLARAKGGEWELLSWGY